MKELIEWSRGHQGALDFLLGLMYHSRETFVIIFNKLQEATNIRGEAIYDLFDKLCDRDYAKVKQLCRTCPTETLVTACMKPDEFGKSLIAEYLAKSNEPNY